MDLRIETLKHTLHQELSQSVKPFFEQGYISFFYIKNGKLAFVCFKSVKKEITKTKLLGKVEHWINQNEQAIKLVFDSKDTVVANENGLNYK